MDKAIDYYNRALIIKPKDAATQYTLGEIYYREWSDSLEASQRKQLHHLFNNPQESQPKENMKELQKYGLKTEYEGLAYSHFKEAIEYDPANWRARLFIAGSYMTNKQYQEAIKEYKKVIELNPEYISVYGSLGRAYLGAGSYDLAVESLNKAIQLDPNNDYDYYSLGMAYRNLNKGDKVYDVMMKLKAMKSPYYDELRLGIFQ
ncbi:MAG: tetratricopeptide repeat protein [Nitrospirae bacterium]|nr:tetratricopeptide repeat protein [Nitrospirota bacterium]